MHTRKRFNISKCFLRRRAMLDARFSQLGLQACFCQRLPTLLRGLSAIADLVVSGSWRFVP